MLQKYTFFYFVTIHIIFFNKQNPKQQLTNNHVLSNPMNNYFIYNQSKLTKFGEIKQKVAHRLPKIP